MPYFVNVVSKQLVGILKFGNLWVKYFLPIYLNFVLKLYKKFLQKRFFKKVKERILPRNISSALDRNTQKLINIVNRYQSGIENTKQFFSAIFLDILQVFLTKRYCLTNFMLFLYSKHLVF